jgi:hypothetical protein
LIKLLSPIHTALPRKYSVARDGGADDETPEVDGRRKPEGLVVKKRTGVVIGKPLRLLLRLVGFAP